MNRFYCLLPTRYSSKQIWDGVWWAFGGGGVSVWRCYLVYRKSYHKVKTASRPSYELITLSLLWKSLFLERKSLYWDGVLGAQNPSHPLLFAIKDLYVVSPPKHHPIWSTSDFYYPQFYETNSHLELPTSLDSFSQYIAAQTLES